MILLSMASLQLLWLSGIWFTGASHNSGKLLLLVVFTVTTGFLTILTPNSLVPKLQVEIGIQHFLRPWRPLLILCVLVSIVGIFYATHQRIWPFDETNSFLAAQTVSNQGISALIDNYVKNPWLGIQHPPLSPLAYGLSLRVFGNELIVIRLVSLLFAILTIVLTHLIGHQLYGAETGLIAAIFLCSFPLFVRLGTAGMVEIPITFFFALTLFLTLKMIQAPNPWLLAALGLCLGMGLLIKYTMLLIFPIIFCYFAICQSFKLATKWFSGLILPPCFMLVTWIIFAQRIGIWQEQINTLSYFAQLVLANPHPYGRNLLFETLTTRLPSALGVYNLPLLGIGCLFLLARRNKADVLILLWVSLVTVPLLLTLPDHRYFMLTFPALALILATALRSFVRASQEKVLLLALLCCGGALYLFVDWTRAAHLFDLTPP